MSFPSSTPYTFSITFNKAYSHLWLLYNQLSQITPIPQHVWDKTSASGPVGNYDMTPAGALKVYKFLNTQSTQQATYASNPLWKVVDGPWNLSAFSPSTGYSAFVPNPTYGGPGKPKIAKLEELPFTSDIAEFDALRSGQLDYGYLPPRTSIRPGSSRAVATRSTSGPTSGSTISSSTSPTRKWARSSNSSTCARRCST